MSNFTQRTQSYPDARLFEIVREAEKYAPEAVTAAEVEIERRGLNGEDFPSAPTSKPFAKVGKVLTQLSPPRAQHRPDDILDWMEQPEEENEAGGKYLLYLMIIIGLTGFVGIYDQWDYLIFSIGPNSYGFDYMAALIILALTFQFFLVYLLWQRSRLAYHLVFCFAIIGTIGTFFLTPYLFEQYKESGDLLSYLSPTVSPVLFLINLGFSLATIWLVTRKDLMNFFGSSKKSLTIAFAIGVAYSLFIQFIGYL